MMNKEKSVEWLQCRTEEYQSKAEGVGDLVEEVEHEGKLGQGFSSIDYLEEMDIGDGSMPRPMYVNTNLTKEQKDKLGWMIIWQT
jgi:hypothetical protein